MKVLFVLILSVCVFMCANNLNIYTAKAFLC